MSSPAITVEIASLRLDAGRLDDRPPLGDLGALVGGERLWRLLLARRNFIADVEQPPAHRRIGERFHHGGAELGDHRLGRALAGPKPAPDRDVHSGKPGLVHGRDVGRRHKPRRRRDGEGLDLAGLNVRQRVGALVEGHVDLSGNQVPDRLHRAAIGHELEARPGAVLEQDAADMRRAADAGISHRRLAGIGLEPGNQALEVVRRHGVVGKDQERLGRDHADRFEVGDEIVFERIDRAIDDVRRPVTDAERIAVARRLRDAADADAAACAGHILHHHRLAERAAHVLGEHSRTGVARAAGGKRHDHGDRPRGERLRRRRAGDGQHRSGERCQKRPPNRHGCDPQASRPTG